MSATRPRAATYEEYTALASESALVEWARGEVIAHLPPTARHQELIRFLIVLLTLFAEHFDVGSVYPAPFAMRLGAQGPAREPDVLFVAKDHADRVRPDGLDGPADLVIEVISEDSVARDRADKFYEYQAAGVAEYWVIDPRPGRQRADFWVLDRPGTYEPVVADTAGVYRSRAVAGFWVRQQWLLADSPPPATVAYREIERAAGR